MYIWLNEKGKKRLEKRKEKHYGEEKEYEFLGDVRVETHENSGKKYIQSYDNPMDPTFVFPNIPQDLIEKVTYRDTIYRGFRVEGLYRHESTTLMVKSTTRVHSEMMSDAVEREEWQEISVSALTIEALRTIYTMVRQGKLAPEENWEQRTLAVAKTPAAETT